MRLQRVPARQGAQWVRQGCRVFFSRPMAFAGLFAAFMFAVFVFLLLPDIGWLLVVASLPLGSLGFMIATRDAVEGRLPTPTAFLLPFRGDRNKRIALAQISISLFVSAFLVIEFCNLLDGGAFANLLDALTASQASPEEAASRAVDAGLMSGLLLRFSLAAVLAIPFWHASALVYWDGHGWGKALFSSTAACWSNKGAFIVFGLTWIAVFVLVGTLTNLVFALLGQIDLMPYALAPMSLILWTIFYVSLYFTFADCFSSSGPPPLPATSLTT